MPRFLHLYVFLIFGYYLKQNIAIFNKPHVSGTECFKNAWIACYNNELSKKQVLGEKVDVWKSCENPYSMCPSHPVSHLTFIPNSSETLCDELVFEMPNVPYGKQTYKRKKVRYPTTTR